MNPEENNHSKFDPPSMNKDSAQNISGVGQQDQARAAAAPSEETEEMKSAKVKRFTSKLDEHKKVFKRALIHNETGATRLRTFHVRLSETAMIFLDDHLNEWLDDNPDIEVKFCNATIGIFEGKRGSENQLILNVWY